MTPPSLQNWLSSSPAALMKGPISIVFIEDDADVLGTLAHHLTSGFRHILALGDAPIDLSSLPDIDRARITPLSYPTRRRAAHVDAVNQIIAAVPVGTWLHYAFNAEYLFFPFSETRRVGEMLAFHTEERRPAMLTYVLDLYPADLAAHPNAVTRTDAMFDRTGYYALGRKGRDGEFLERQLDFHGGLRWRFEEYLPADRRRIDRIGLFRAAPGLEVTQDHRFNDEEYNTYACPWHHNLTAVIASFRVAKALVHNPTSRGQIDDFTWSKSEPFRWSAQQLMELGLMEPGQWF